MSETIPASQPELRHTFVAELRGTVDESGNGQDRTFVGHAAVFDSWSEDLETPYGTFREKVAPGAFDDVLARQPDVRLLVDHVGLPLARTKAGTLDLSVDEVGLRSWARLSSKRGDVIDALERGDVDQMSFAFTVAEDEWRDDKDSEIVERTILRVGDLYDVSIVTYPAYPDTDAAVRELRSAAEAGKISLPTDVAQDDPAGNATVGDSEEVAQDDPAGTKEDLLAALRTASSETVQRERESYLRLLKELAR